MMHTTEVQHRPITITTTSSFLGGRGRSTLSTKRRATEAHDVNVTLSTAFDTTIEVRLLGTVAYTRAEMYRAARALDIAADEIVAGTTVHYQRMLTELNDTVVGMPELLNVVTDVQMDGMRPKVHICYIFKF